MIFVTGDRDAGNARTVWAYEDDGTPAWYYDTADATYKCVADAYNNVFIVGKKGDDGDGDKNLWKLNQAGTKVNSLYVQDEAVVYDVVLDEDGNVFIAKGTATATYQATKISPDFSTETEFAAGNLNTGNAIMASAIDGHIYEGSGGFADDFRKFDKDSLSTELFDEDESETCYGIAELSDGNVLAAMGENLYCYANDGSGEVWHYAFGAAYTNTRVVVDSDDNIYVSFNKYLARLDSDGNEIWKTTHADVLYGVAVAFDDSIIVCGARTGGYTVWDVTVATGALVDFIDTGTIARGVCGTGTVAAGGAIADSRKFTKKLVAIGNREVWYESTPGTMTELAAATGTLNTSAALMATEAAQKVFIVNGTTKKVVDFGNTKIATNDILLAPGTAIPTRGQKLTGGTSGALMIVDLITASDGACSVYGFRYSTATFATGETVTGTGGVSFVLNANEVAPPHYYNWITYAADTTTYGSVPEKITGVALYAGRILAWGHPPYEWYATRQMNPWDFNNGATDDARALFASNTSALRIGDTVVTAIPYKDDICVWGCANSLWCLIGNPAAGGTIQELDLTCGLLSANAHAWDNKENLFLITTSGLLVVPRGFGPPENLTEVRYPQFISDLAFDASIHRLTLTYDRQHNGLIICRTVLATGESTAWWFDLRSNGLFPEQYPNDCGMFSSHYYAAISPDYRKTLIGCNDGYIREYAAATKNDTLFDDTTQAIDSYVGLGPIPMSPKSGEGQLSNLHATLAGGLSGGGDDSSSVGFQVYAEDTAEEVISKMVNGSAPKAGGTFTGPGRMRGNKHTQKVRGSFAGVKLRNDTASQTWAFEKLTGDVKPTGRAK